MKASKVAAALTEELRAMRLGTYDNPRSVYRDANGRRCRGVLILNPIDQARRYLAWLREGGAAPHWEFFEETGEHHRIAYRRERAKEPPHV